MRGKLVFVAAVAAMVGGCGAQGVPTEGEAASPLPPQETRTAQETRIPVDPLTTAPPNGFTDQGKKTDWVVGTVTNTSSGPCYGLETDEGTQYALHATSGSKLVKGQRVRVKTGPMLVRMYCGPGTHLEMVSAQPL